MAMEDWEANALGLCAGDQLVGAVSQSSAKAVSFMHPLSP